MHSYLRLQTIPTLLGFDPMIQIVDEKDLTAAFALSLQKGVRGIYNIIGKDSAPLSKIINYLNKSSYPIPEWVLQKLLSGAFAYNLISFPPGEIQHLKYTNIADGTRAFKELGYKPKIRLKETLRNLTKRNKDLNVRLVSEYLE